MDLLPVKYCGHKSAWMTSEIFHTWFHDSFVPTVREKLALLGLSQKAVLVPDNCPNVEDLTSEDGKITALYLPPNVTSLIQPMDQGVLVTLKRLYKKKLLRRLLIEDENGISVINFLKSVDMKVVVDLVAESWDEIEAATLSKSWRKILSIEQPNQGQDDIQNSVETLDKHEDDSVHDTEEFIHEFQELGYSMDQNEIHTWLNSDANDHGFQLMNDEEICEHVITDTVESNESEGPDLEENICPVSNSEAAHMFEKCLIWLEHQSEANVYNICTLKELQSLAVRKRMKLMKQKTIPQMLHVPKN